MTTPTKAQIKAAKKAADAQLIYGSMEPQYVPEKCIVAAITAAAEVRPADISCPFCGGENGKHDLNCGLYRPAAAEAGEPKYKTWQDADREDRNITIERCAQDLDEMVAAAKAVGTHKEQIIGLASAAAAIRALKDD